MTEMSAHAPAPQACRPTNPTQCSTCSLSYDCRSTSRSTNLSWPLVLLGLMLGTGLILRIAGVV